ncbi:hypothetical protein [Bryobacter aggregatus]|uniref:hypothetical protein n=1 Tax=Bryobacter aggregatus TaxID=360054 RepID=UPI0004E27658|nr:hypothetical protein [Bryobacter aggregatus]
MANPALRSGALADLFVRGLVTAAEPKFPHFVIRTQPRAERQVRDRLLAQGFEALYLKFLPNFLFTRFSPSQRLQIASIAGVHSIIGVAAQPVAVDEKELDALVRVAECRLRTAPAPFPAEGHPCLLRSGPLEGVSGRLTTTCQPPLFLLSLSVLQRCVSIPIETAWL